ncbi:MAG: aldehyde dehydrogenase family protein, partial [bacterium]|nr:aldehyde dehydrogenase family protein [bacterium]
MVFTTLNPATGEKLATYEAMSPGQVAEILETLGSVQPRWRKEEVGHRAQRLGSLSKVLREEKANLAALLTSEMG